MSSPSLSLKFEARGILKLLKCLS
jgi:hypothetical protein